MPLNYTVYKTTATCHNLLLLICLAPFVVPSRSAFVKFGRVMVLFKTGRRVKSSDDGDIDDDVVGIEEESVSVNV